jgi:hypothetical protein
MNPFRYPHGLLPTPTICCTSTLYQGVALLLELTTWYLSSDVMFQPRWDRIRSKVTNWAITQHFTSFKCKIYSSSCDSFCGHIRVFIRTKRSRTGSSISLIYGLGSLDLIDPALPTLIQHAFDTLMAGPGLLGQTPLRFPTGSLLQYLCYTTTHQMGSSLLWSPCSNLEISTTLLPGIHNG